MSTKQESRLTELPDRNGSRGVILKQTNKLNFNNINHPTIEVPLAFAPKPIKKHSLSPMRKVYSVDALRFDLYQTTKCEKRENIPTLENAKHRYSSSASLSWSKRVHVSNSKSNCTKEENTMTMRKVASWSGSQYTRGRRISYPPRCSAEPESEATFSLSLVPRVLAKLSVFLMIIAAAVDLTSKSNDSYLLRASTANNNRPALGSAAITSVTEALYPILPFTGGIDLRKEDYWIASSPLESIKSIAGQVWEAFELSNKNPTTSNKLNSSQSHTTTFSSAKPKISHALTLSSSESFISKEAISELTLEEVGQVLNYASECNLDSFDEQRFAKAQSSRVRKVILAMKDAVAKSRGKDVLLSKRTGAVKKQNQPGSIDALMFLAAIRIFGEWRIIRFVPDGYKSYAVGMNLGYKDIIQNIAKVEIAVHDWLDLRQASLNGETLRSPTVGEILQYESEEGVHPNLPRLKDRTAAMGLLWISRQLQYQNLVYENIIEHAERFKSTADGVEAAYRKVYNQYHGWAVQKIFSYSFQAAPAPAVIFRHMNPHKMKELRENGIPTHQMKIASDREEDSPIMNEHNPFVSWCKKLEKDLDNNPVVSWLKKVGDDSRNIIDEVRTKLFVKQNVQNIKVSEDLSEIEDFITAEMTKNAKDNTVQFLRVARPLASDLSEAIARFNMNDPTKV